MDLQTVTQMIKTMNLSFRMILAAIILNTFFAGCSSKPAYYDAISFEKGSWNRFRYLNFEFLTDNPEMTYDLSVIITYNDYINIDMLPVNVVMVLPGGEERIREYNIFLKERNGAMKGEKKEGRYELKVLLRESQQFTEKGPVKIEIENLNPKLETPGVLSFGLLVEKNTTDH